MKEGSFVNRIDKNLRVFAPIAIFVLSAAAYFYFIYISYRCGGDDTRFQKIALSMSMWEWLNRRFETTSMRVLSDIYVYIFSYLPLAVFKIYNFLMHFLFAFFFYKFAILFNGKNKLLWIVISVLSPFLINIGAYVDSALWVTGTMYYLWVAVPAIIGGYLLCEEILLSSQSSKRNIGRIISLFFLCAATISSEQLGSVIIVALLCYSIYCYSTKKGYIYYLAAFLLNTVLFWVTKFYGPGTQYRIDKYVNNNMPDFYTVDIRWHAEYAIRWFMDAVVNHMGFVMLLILMTESILIIFEFKKSNITKVILLSLMISGCLMMILRRLGILIPTEFYATWGKTDFGPISYLVIIYWLFVMISMLVAMPLTYGVNFFTSSVVLGLCASLASTFIIVFSPTMYDSRGRVMYYPTLIMITVLILFLSKLQERKSYLFIQALMVLFALYNFRVLLMIFQDHFMIHLKW